MAKHHSVDLIYYGRRAAGTELLIPHVVVLRQKVAVEKHDMFVCVNACFLRYAFGYVDMSIGAKAEGRACLSAESPFAVLFLHRVAIFVSSLSMYFVVLFLQEKLHFLARCIAKVTLS